MKITALDFLLISKLGLNAQFCHTKNNIQPSIVSVTNFNYAPACCNNIHKFINRNCAKSRLQYNGY